MSRMSVPLCARTLAASLFALVSIFGMVPAQAVQSTPAWTAESNQAGALFGFGLDRAGDVDGFGETDIIVGAPFYDNGQTDEGRAYLYLSFPGSTPSWTYEVNQAGSLFGFAVSHAGDVNFDGFADVLVAAPYYDNGQADEGRVYLFLGSASSPYLTFATTIESNQAGALFGFSLGWAGDVNGDSRSDILVGAPLYDNGQVDEGRAYLYLGSSSAPYLTLGTTIESNQAGANFGYSVSGDGADVNRAGSKDVVVGAPAYDNGQTDEGRVYLYLGQTTSPYLTLGTTLESNQVGAQFGTSVAMAGDVNGGGHTDVLIGAPTYDNGQTDEGRAYLYLGQGASPYLTLGWTEEPNQVGAQFGTYVAWAMNVNFDSYQDVIVGAPLYDNGQTDEGRAYIYRGQATAPYHTLIWTAESDQSGALFGFTVASAGNVNPGIPPARDNYSDVLVAAVEHDNGQTDEGRAYLYLGGP